MALKLTKGKKPQLRGHQRIEASDPEIRDQIDQLIFSGETDYAIRVRVLKDWTHFEDMAERTLDRAIQKYRESEPAQERQRALEEEASKMSVTRFDRDVNVLTELQRITMMQKERLDKVFLKEEASPLPLDMVSKEMDVYKRLLVETGKLQLDLGVVQRAPKKITGVMAGPDGRSSTFSWREEQDALLAVVQAGK